jgi:lipid II:glycine glycyltransferase (peptidoglycan interpeptide bridge formation enzyme)
MPKGVMRLELGGMEPGRPLATAIIHDYNGVATYTFAASSYEARKTAVGNALVYQAMKNAKARGCHSFDLYGIAGPKARPDDPWLGFTFFKQAYGGQEVALGGTWDIPLSPLYYAFAAHSRLRHSARRFKQTRLKRQKH